tara:strand:- start:1431 stop:1979 length:549 start_codon:yes stop_codon:yes gene_type:complete
MATNYEDTSRWREVGSLGKSGITDFADHNDMSQQLESFEAPDGVGEISFHTDEFYSTCPVTGQPDFSSIDIVYMPNRRCIESKSLKLYFQSFRDKGSFVEQLAADICSMVLGSVEPLYVKVRVKQSPRGGITTIAESCFTSTLPDSTLDQTWDKGNGYPSRELVEHDFIAKKELGGIGHVSH